MDPNDSNRENGVGMDLTKPSFVGLDGDALRWLAAVLEGEVGWGAPW